MTNDELESDEFGVNGVHEEIGQRYSNAQFKGRMLEFVRNHETHHKDLDKKVSTNEKILFVAIGGFSVLMLILQYLGGL